MARRAPRRAVSVAVLAALTLTACTSSGGESSEDPEPAASFSSNVEVVPSGRAHEVDPCWGRLPTIVGTAGDDRIEATPEADTIVALGGDDHITGMRRGDVLCAGDGHDVVEDVDGAGPLLMGDGDDVVRAGDVSEVRLGPGDDRFSAVDSFFVVDPGLGNDVVVALQTDRTEAASLPCVDLRSAPLPLQVDLTAGTARGEGTDRLRGFHCVLTGKYGDVVLGTAERDRLYLGEGADLARAGGGDDFISGEHGNDRIVAGDGDDLVYGEEGNDRLHGGAGDDTLSGWSGADFIEGGPGDDDMYAGLSCETAVRTCLPTIDAAPNDLRGGPGNDCLIGDLGTDRVDGGPGRDARHGAYQDGRTDRISSIESVVTRCTRDIRR